ncbi:MAG: YkgJ family cysteine cluster protein [Planctomycetota bacterium]|jgi:Fe-S-cluster containining protein
MTENLSTATLWAPRRTTDRDGDTTLIGLKRSGGNSIIGLRVNIPGRALNFRIGVAKRQARLADIVPLARRVCSEIVKAAIENACRQGRNVPCRKGCAGCCNSYLVPLSIPEALRLSQEIMEAPGCRRESMRNACFLTAWTVLNKRPPIPLKAQETTNSSENPEFLKLVSNWYADFKLPCPFLYRGACTIYQQRPLACREYFITGSAKACSGSCDKADLLAVPVRMVEVLGQLASELEGTKVEALILPFAVAWSDSNQHRDQRTWPEPMMVKRFAEIIETVAAEYSAAPGG